MTTKYAVRSGDDMHGSYVEFDSLTEALEFKGRKGERSLVYEPLALTAAKKVYYEWEPIDTAPKDGREILVGWVGAKMIRPARWAINGQTWLINAGVNKPLNSPTHWMPMPEPPK